MRQPGEKIYIGWHAMIDISPSKLTFQVPLRMLTLLRAAALHREALRL